MCRTEDFHFSGHWYSWIWWSGIYFFSYLECANNSICDSYAQTGFLHIALCTLVSLFCLSPSSPFVVE
jgi:hypothetical protein